MSAPSEAGSATAAALKFERRAELGVPRYVGFSARDLAVSEKRRKADAAQRRARQDRADDAWNAEVYVFWSVLGLYVLTVAPSVAGGDSGELLAESCSLGTAHPPGYPLFTLLYHIPLTWTPSLITPAMWANLFTAFLGACASAAVCAVTREALRCGGQPGSPLAGITSAAHFAFSPLVWQYHCTAEVFALNNLLVALLVHRALLYSRRREARDLRGAALLTGLALSNQHTAVLFAVPLAGRAFMIAAPYLRKKPKEVFILGLWGLLGLSPYVYLPLTTAKQGSWGHVRSLRGFVHHFLRRDYGTLRLYSGRVGSGESVYERMWAWYVNVATIQGPAPHLLPLLALGGVVLLTCLQPPQQPQCNDDASSSKSEVGQSSKARRRARVQEYNTARRAENEKRRGTQSTARTAAQGCREAAACLGGALLFYLLAFHTLSNLPLDDPLLYGIHARFWMQPHIALCCLAGCGIEGLVRLGDHICERRRSLHVACVFLLISLQIRAGLAPPGQSPGAPGGLFSRRLGMHKAHPAHFFGDYARALLKPLPQNALLLINYDQQWTSVRYLQKCEGFRTDVTAINLAMTTYSWWHTKRALYSDVIFPGTHYSKDATRTSGYSIGSFFDANFEKRPGGIFLGGTLSFPDQEYKERYEFVPYGLVSVLSLKARPPSLDAYVLESRKAWSTALNEMRRLPLDPSHNSMETWEWTIQREVFTHLADRSAYVLEAVLRDDMHDSQFLYEAAMWFEQLYAYDVNMTTANVKNMGLAHVHLVRSTKGKAPVPSVPDILGASGLLSDVSVPFAELHPQAVGADWKTWSSARFQVGWGDFLSRPDAAQDPQYATIRDLYAKVTTASRTASARV